MQELRITRGFLSDLLKHTLKTQPYEEHFNPAVVLNDFDLNPRQYFVLREFIETAFNGVKDEYHLDEAYREKVKPHVHKGALVAVGLNCLVGGFVYSFTRSMLATLLASYATARIVGSFERNNRFFAAYFAGISPRIRGAALPKGFCLHGIAEDTLSKLEDHSEIRIKLPKD